MIETERKKVGLKKGAVPSIFPNCPSYLTDTTASCQRLSLYDNQKSLEEFKETEAKFYISTLNCIHSKLHLVDLPVGWVIYQPNSATILFLKIQYHNEISTIERSIIIDENFIVRLFIRKQTKFNYPATHLPIPGHWKISFIKSNHLKFIKLRM